MKIAILGTLLALSFSLPSLPLVKGVTLFFQTGDELFEIDGAPKLDEGYSVGYACQRFALFYADIWTWDCELVAVNIDEFTVRDLDPDIKAEMESQYSLSDRNRNLWNQHGIIAMMLLVTGGAVTLSRK